jgi:hypothetical protein
MKLLILSACHAQLFLSDPEFLIRPLNAHIAPTLKRKLNICVNFLCRCPETSGEFAVLEWSGYISQNPWKFHYKIKDLNLNVTG